MKNPAKILIHVQNSVLIVSSAVTLLSAPRAEAALDTVNGNLVQFNDNGAWTWFSDQRAIVDPVGGKLVVGVDASGVGYGGSLVDGSVQAPMFDIRTGISTRTTLMSSGTLGPDDHNGPALMIRPDG